VNTAKPFVGALKRSVISRIPTDIGEFQLCLYVNNKDDKEHIALIMGKVKDKPNILVRIHSECFTGEVLGSCRCDCKEQLHLAMQKIAEEGCGVLIYLRQEGRGIGLSDKLRAYNLQDQGYDTVDANLLLGHQVDERDYTIAALILEDLQVRSVRLLTNNPLKIESLRELGVVVERQLPLHPTVNESNFRYLLTKASRMNHLLNLYSTLYHEENCVKSDGQQVDTVAEAQANAHRLLEKKVIRNRDSLYFADRQRVMVREEELPKINASQVLVKTLLSAISPGTESLIYRGEFPEGESIDVSIPGLSNTLVYPLKYGYSAVGQVIESGEEVDSNWKNRYVMAFHPHESYFIADPSMLLPLPKGVTLEDAVFLPNMETAVNFVMDGKPLIGENVAVFGQGIVGLLTTSLLATLPLSNLVTLDYHSLRREASRKVGALVSLSPEEADLKKSLDEHLPNGADLTYEISGSPAALDQAILATGFAGRIVIGSWYGSKRTSVDLGGRFHRSRIQLISSQVSSIASEFGARWTKKRRFDVAWEMIRQLKPSHLITHRFSIKEALRAYQLLDQNPAEVIQIVFSYDE